MVDSVNSHAQILLVNRLLVMLIPYPNACCFDLVQGSAAHLH